MRVVPIAKVAPQAPEPRHVIPEAPTPFRLRKYGAPLVRTFPGRAAPRVQPDRDAARTIPEQLQDGVSSEFEAYGVEEGDGGEAIASNDLVIWEQSKEPGAESPGPLPRAPDSADPVLSEQQYAELGSYVGFLLSGFCDFCKTPAVTESGPWRARLDMPQVVLPETVLELSVTAQDVKLRFETEHKIARDVLERYIARLQSEVRIAIGDSRTVEVVLW